jgi:hypothetical protein
MYRELGTQFLPKNIRFGLGEKGGVNNVVEDGLKAIVVTGTGDPKEFVFNHNGIMLNVAEVKEAGAEDGGATHVLVSPKLLNGAQTVTTTANQIERTRRNRDQPRNARRSITPRAQRPHRWEFSAR